MAHGVKKSNELDLAAEGTVILSKPGLCKCGFEYSYTGLGHYKCEHCGDVFLDEYGKIREFIDQYGSTYSLYDISTKTGVSKKFIDAFVQQGRFSEVSRVNKCAKCGKIIHKGTYCEQCTFSGEQYEEKRAKFASMLNKDYNVKGEMRYFDNKK